MLKNEKLFLGSLYLFGGLNMDCEFGFAEKHENSDSPHICNYSGLFVQNNIHYKNTVITIKYRKEL